VQRLTLRLLKPLFSLVLLAGLVWMLDVPALLAQLRQVQPVWVLVACLAVLFGQLLSAWRWSWLARGLALRAHLPALVRYYFLGMFLSLFLPSIIGGDVARGYLLARQARHTAWPAAASVVLERLNGMVGLVTVASLAMLGLDLPRVWLAIWLAGVAFIWLLMLTQPWWWPRLARLSLPERLAGWQRLPLNSPALRRAWWLALPASCVFQMSIVAAHVALGHAVGLVLSWPAFTVMVCLVALASALPISLNGLGVREVGYVSMAVYFGGNAEAAAAMAALWLFVLFVVALPGYFVLWRLGGLQALRAAAPAS